MKSEPPTHPTPETPAQKPPTPEPSTPSDSSQTAPYDRPDMPGRSARRGGWVWRLLVGGIAFIALLAGGVWLAWTWLDPFGDKVTERGGPALLQSIHDLSRFEAASGDFQVVVDLERDAAFLPDAIKGERTLFVAAGGVDAYVDFAALSGDALTVSDDRTAVAVRLPRARLEKPNLDNDRSYVFAHQRGLFDRLGDFMSGSPDDQRELYTLAEKKIAEAATAGDLRARAEQNTKAMLQGLFKSLGFTKVTVEFDAAP
ncbi:Protein of unknown function [Sinosporangium album]|uniref:DUF4230 domain-containing protein n=1 Tax=Sinosporangium album TaxID=504805 RepID=A0A1G7V519_9ACTN|nr:DUF4230 domain-containing protein [Sinosporangium album]SDG54854.1 Protein of unknown function [Sinosporangium album]